MLLSLWFMPVIVPKPLPTFGRLALSRRRASIGCCGFHDLAIGDDHGAQHDEREDETDGIAIEDKPPASIGGEGISKVGVFLNLSGVDGPDGLAVDAAGADRS